jgi:hypothetical protein
MDLSGTGTVINKGSGTVINGIKKVLTDGTGTVKNSYGSANTA